MAVAAGLERPVLGDAGFLGEARQRVVFAEDGDDRAALARLAHHAVGMPATFSVMRKPWCAQLGEVLGAGARLGVAELRHAPDAVAQGDEARLDRVDAAPDVAAVVHARLPIHCKTGIILPASPDTA